MRWPSPPQFLTCAAFHPDQNNKTYALQVSFVDAASDTSTGPVALATSTQLTEVDAAALRRGRTAD